MSASATQGGHNQHCKEQPTSEQIQSAFLGYWAHHMGYDFLWCCDSCPFLKMLFHTSGIRWLVRFFLYRGSIPTCISLATQTDPLFRPACVSDTCNHSVSVSWEAVCCDILDSVFITFCVSRRRRKMYCGHARLCVCLSAAVRPHYCTDLDVTWGA